MKRMRRYLALLLAVAMMMSMVRYGGSFADATETSAEIETVESVKEAEENTEAEEKEKTTEAEEKEEKTTEAEEEEETTEAEEKEEKTTEAEEEEKTTEAEEEEKTTEAEVKEEKTTEAAEETVEAAAEATEAEETTEAAEETTEAVEETTEAAEETTEAEPTKTVYTYEDSKVKVTATLQYADAIPDEAEFVVTALDEDSDAYEKAVEAIRKTTDKSQVYYLYDMRFEVDGEEIEPEDGIVHIAVDFKKKVIETEDDTDVQVFHVTDAGEVEDVDADVDVSSKGNVKNMEYDLDSFSVTAFGVTLYGVKHTGNNNYEAVSTAVEDKWSDKYSYTLENLLNGYNVVAFGDVTMSLHCMGAVLVEGDYTDKAYGFADGSDLPPSYVKGKLSGGVYNSRNKNSNDALYLGSGNELTFLGYYPFCNINSKGGIGNYTSGVYLSDDYFDFEAAKNVVTSAESYLQSGSTAAAESQNKIIEVQAGSNVTISSLDGIDAINIVGTSDANTIINITQSGSVSLPMEYINGSQPAVEESNDDGTRIVWNVPNATSVTIPTQNWIGHVIAADAAVSMESGNYNGTIVCTSFSTGAEGHCYPYKGTGFGVKFQVSKEFAEANTWPEETTYKVKIEATNTDTPLPSTTELTLSKSDSKLGFGTIDYEWVGNYSGKTISYYYIISEEKPDTINNGVIYDEYVYIVKIDVKYENGTATIDKTSYLRLKESLVKKESLENIDGVDGYVRSMDEYYSSFNIADSASTLKFVNDVTKLEITKNVTINGDDATEATNKTLADGTYEFEVKDESGAVVASTEITITNGKSNTATVYNLAPGKYTVSEKGTDKNYIDLTTDNDVKVEVTESKTAKVSFTNAYSETGTAELKVKKNYNGSSYPTEDNTFRFTLTALQNAPMPSDVKDGGDTKTIEVKNAEEAAGKSFGSITYDEDGDYYYTISEEIPKDAKENENELNGITYSTVTYYVHVKVEEGSGGVKTVTVESKTSTKDRYTTLANSTAEFTNTYSETGTAELKVKKIYNGNSYPTGDNTFRFTLTALQNAPMPSDVEDGVYTKTIEVKNAEEAAGKSFGSITYDTNGYYYYTISEKIPDEAKANNNVLDGITYDTTTYYVEVHVGDGTNGKKNVKVSYNTTGIDKKFSPVRGNDPVYTAEFTNTYTKTYTLPKTGGIGTYPYIGGGVLLMAGTLLYGYEEARKRRKAGRRA